MSENIELAEFVELLQKWHDSMIEQLKLIVDQKDACIQLGDIKIEADSEMAKGIRTGVAIAIDSFKLPFSVNKNTDNEIVK